MTGLAIVAAALVVNISTGLAGRDFGVHWDEPVQFGLVNQTIRTGVLLPLGFFNYPSLTYIFSLVASAAHVFRHLGTDRPLTPAQFYLPARSLFIVVVALGSVPLYFALRREVSEIASAFAASAYLLSSELAYHERWIAPDALLAATTSLTLLAITTAHAATPATWRRALPILAAVVAASAKYQGAVFLVPAIALFAERSPDAGAPRYSFARAASAIALFTAGFLVLNPGAILQPSAFVEDVTFENRHYRTTHGVFAGARPYDVASPVSYAKHLVLYVVGVLPSTSLLVALTMTAAAVIGLVILIQRTPRLAASVVAPFAVLALYFTTLHVFIARNFLLFLPGLLFLAAFALDRAWASLRSSRARATVGILLALPLLLGGARLVSAANSIRARGEATTANLARQWLSKHHETSIAVTASSRSLLDRNRAVPPGVVLRDASAQGSLVLLLSDLRNGVCTAAALPATNPGTYTVMGPDDVNFDYYPSWGGDDRVILFTPRQRRRLGITCH